MIIALQTLVFFRESLLDALSRLLSPYYKRLRGTFSGYDLEEDEEIEEVFAEFDDEKGVVFFPPVYAQRYAAISDCLMDERWCGKLSKLVDLGYHDISFIKYLKDLPGVECILGVDIESMPLRCSSDLFDGSDYGPKREKPLQVTLFQGNAADPDYRLLGCDAVVAIEMIEHMLPHDLERLVHTIFGFIKPWVTIITTPNADFNELFKSLEKNGLRRLDHYFEWTREQFHDWCSNIVTRYPSFSVSCQGVGPGPPGTEHRGCCSQLALFVNKQYSKQEEQPRDSLARVSNFPSPHNLSELINGFQTATTNSDKMLLDPKENAESLTDFLYSNKSCVTLVLSSSSADYSISALEYQDKASQCNMDTELGKNFIMFNDEDMYYTILQPRRKRVDHRIYEIEDVNSRLNCTTLQARKFSKTTQNLMAKNRVDSFAHTREVVSEIQHLTKMLNFNKDSVPQKTDGNIWCNINWGENAPYWNQYYTVVKDYNYPFEEKSEECRILDLIWEEINRIVDMHCEEEFTTDGNRLQIPVEHLMRAVSHLTTDVDKVKDLLEWNGYEVAGNFVIHSRITVDAASMGSTEIDWPEIDTTSELDTIDGQSTYSDGSALVPDIHGQYLHRALDKKVQALRKMLSANEDITSELDRVVCRLMKLALRSSKGKQDPPPAKWMQCKLLDLLTLTERAISRRKLHYLQSFPKQVEFNGNVDILNKKMIENTSGKVIVDKYKYLLQQPAYGEIFDVNLECGNATVRPFDSNDLFKDYNLHKIMPRPYVLSIDRPYELSEVSLSNNQSNHMSNLDPETSDQKSSKRPCTLQRSTIIADVNKISRKRPYSKVNDCKSKSHDKISMSKKSKSNIVVKSGVKKSSHSLLKLNAKKNEKGCKNYALMSRRVNVHKKLQPTASKPIPGSLIELCHPEVNMLLHSKHFHVSSREEEIRNSHSVKDTRTDVAAIEESVLIDIVMDDTEETIALRRSIGTDPEFDCSAIEQEISSAVANEFKDDYSAENVHSQTIFLYDINEPSTSKGVRHTNTDVQCGTDTISSPSRLLTSPASVKKLPKMYSTGIRIDSSANIATEKMGIDFGTCTNLKYDNETFTRDKSSNTNLNSTSGFFSSSNVLNSVTPRTKSPDAILQANDSHANLLINFNVKYPQHISRCASPNRGCRSPFTRNKSPTFNGTGLTIKDSTTNTQTVFHTDCAVMTNFDNSKNEISYDVLTEENAQTELPQLSPSTQCEFVNSNFVPDKHRDFTFSIKNSLHVTKSPTRHIGTSTDGEPFSINLSSSTNGINNSENLNNGSFTIINLSKQNFNDHNDTLENTNASTVSPKKRDKFKDTEETVVKEVDFSTAQVEIMSDTLNCRFPIITSFKTEPHKTDESAFDFCSTNNYPSTRQIWRRTIPQETTSEFIINQSECSQKEFVTNQKREMSPTKRIQGNLSCGGVHVHSFKEKQFYEDIVYQGEWERYTPKTPRKSFRTITVISKKVPESIRKHKTKREPLKQKLQIKQIDAKHEIKNEPKKPLRIRNTKPIKVKQEIINNKNELIKKVAFSNLGKTIRVNNKISTKITSKTTASTITSKNVKSIRSAKKPPNCKTLNNIINNESVKDSEPIKKIDVDSKYLPPYLRRRKFVSSESKFNKSYPNPVTMINLSQMNSKDDVQFERIKTSLLKVQDDLQNDINYVVFRNYIENTNPIANSSQSNDITNRNENNRRRVINKRSSSPIAETSSNCSPTDSIATVRANNRSKIVKRLSASSNKSGIANTDSETSPINNKNKKFSKKCKLVKKSESKDQSNKENLPESSKRCLSNKEISVQNIKKTFLGRNKNVFIAKLQDSNLTINEKYLNLTKSNIKISSIESDANKKTLLLKDAASKEDTARQTDSIKSETSNLVLLVEPHKDHITLQEKISQHVPLEKPELNVVDSKLLTEWFERGNISAIYKEYAENAILAQMRQLVEERLDFIGGSLNDTSFEDNTSLLSFKTIIPAEDTDLDDTLKIDIENAMNHSLDAVVGDESDFSLPNDSTTDVDLISFKSITSVSRYSDYYMAESNRGKAAVQLENKTASSVLDIFERKEPTFTQLQNGTLAAQACSGFSMDIENFVGDYKNVDSETGPLAVDVNRQATSEEMFVSGRSSETYESCVVEEEVAVPDWLFHVMNPQLAIDQQPTDPVAYFDSETGSPALGNTRSHPPIDEEEDLQELVSLRLPMVEPVFDVNGNVVEPGIGLGAGAGDGRGMHSDHSQDSSGRGSSLSSTDASSGQHSEAILIDPSAFTTQYELFHESVGSSMAVTTLVVPLGTPEAGQQGRNESAVVSTSRNMTARTGHSTLTSDGEADVSSLDTDVPDSS